jgi:CRISPR system Cascade subunit CasD
MSAAAANTVFLRLAGPLQAWGDNSKFVIRRTMEAPTKSGLLGLICCAMGKSRREASEFLPELNELRMGVRIDRRGTRWWDWHTVGAGIGILRADGKGIKRTGGRKDDPIETLISRREYLCDASFLVALQGDAGPIQDVACALKAPKWPVFLGRKSCPPSLPVFSDVGRYASLKAALSAVPWPSRYSKREHTGEPLGCLIEWRRTYDEDVAPADAEVWYDRPVSFDPPVHEPRLVVRDFVSAEPGDPTQHHTPPLPRPRAKYGDERYKEARKQRLREDHGLCVFCKSLATTVQHVTYRRAGGDEKPKDLRSLCRLCHDAVTMIEYGLGMELDRINPEDPQWRDKIIQKRDEIIRFRSVEGRRRALRAAPDRVRRELLEEEEA